MLLPLQEFFEVDFCEFFYLEVSALDKFEALIETADSLDKFLAARSEFSVTKFSSLSRRVFLV